MVPVVFFDCIACKHLKKSPNGVLTCAAFPDGIPKDYIEGKKHPHLQDECRLGVKFEDTRRPELRKFNY